MCKLSSLSRSNLLPLSSSFCLVSFLVFFFLQKKQFFLFFFIHCYLETLQHLRHIASRIFGCIPEGCVFLLLRVVNVSIVKFTDLIFMIYEFDE